MAAINKVPLAKKFLSFKELQTYLTAWRKTNHDFRIDGVPGIAPANPSQWIFFRIDSFLPESFAGEEISGKLCNGTSWNGLYYLAGATRRNAIDAVLNLSTKNNNDPNKIFTLAYTKGKEGFPNKRRLELNGEEGWFCIKYKD